MLCVERSVEPPKQVIEGVPEFLELVRRAVEGQALVQTGGGDPSGGAGDGPDRSQHPAGNDPAGHQGQHRHDRKSDCRVDQKLVRVGSALCGLDGPYLCQLVYSVCQLALALGQLILGLCELMPDPCQLARHTQYQPGRSLRQLLISLPQLLLSLCQLMRMLDNDGLALRQSLSRRTRKLEMLYGESVWDLRQMRRSVFGRPLKKDVGGGDQRDAGQEEQAAVESGEPKPGGAARQSQPGGWREPGKALVEPCADPHIR